MCALSPRRNCSLSTLAEKNSTWTRSMMTAMAKTRQMAMGYMPGPPPFQCCARVSKNWFIVSSAPQRVRNPPCRGMGSPDALPLSIARGHPRLARRILGAHARDAIVRPLPPRGSARRGAVVSEIRLLAGAFASSADRLASRLRMASGPDFPKVRHIALSTAEPGAGADALIVPFEAAQPEPAEPAQGAPEGALPAAARAAAPAATGVPPTPPTPSPSVARVVVVDVARARDDGEACRTAAGATVVAEGRPVRCPNSAAGLEHAGGVAAWATHLGEAVLLDGLDRW